MRLGLMEVRAAECEGIRKISKYSCNGSEPSVYPCSDLGTLPCRIQPGHSLRRRSIQLGGESMSNAMESLGNRKPRMQLKLYITIVAVLLVGVAWAFSAKGAPQVSDDQNHQSSACASLPSFAALKNALATATAAEMSGLNNQMWATLVDRDGIVCAVAFSGVNRGAQW